MPKTPGPDQLTLEETARRLGVCKRRILSEFIRHGLLPYPAPGALFQLADVEACAARFEVKRGEAPR